jgi:hypothetical protein
MGNPAELLVVDEFGNGGILAADGASRILADFDLAKAAIQGDVTLRLDIVVPDPL